ncbi:hypothetical protein BkAM31D_14125 [Halalkalibacter krulwichiae]|uniref:Uncharacterized protein n=1 Tax=Halalkalibacter krulwichiae TaxID=199441 RepID=A0A1X9ME26_9BACI|nr:hypothetical protein BkAM31D_14125 [Halalkalibacter krulwichiae]
MEWLRPMLYRISSLTSSLRRRIEAVFFYLLFLCMKEDFHPRFEFFNLLNVKMIDQE